MKNFITKVSIITLPFLISYFTYLSNFSSTHDLSRIGHTTSEYNFYYEHESYSFFEPEFRYNFNSTSKEFKVLNIGDSFSKQELNKFNGYTSFLRTDQGEVVNMPFCENPLKRIKRLIELGYFLEYTPEYVIIETVERAIPQRIETIDETDNFLEYIDMLKHDKLVYKMDSTFCINNKNPKDFFSNTTLFYPINSIFKYDVNGNVVKFNLKKAMFSSQDKSLLVYKDDLYSNVSEELVFYENLNNYLNEIQSLLEKFNVKIILLVCPDKYTFYEEEIMEYDKNISKIFFDYFARLDHNYYFYNSLDSLRGLNSSDLYFYDDTHWSPISAEKVAEDLNSIIFD